MSLAKKLIRDLQSNPKQFEDQGKANQLLKEYFKGFPIDTLRPLLTSRDQNIRRAAIWIASELGSQGSSLLPEVITLLEDGDPFIQYNALESIMACAKGDYVNKFVYILYSLESGNDLIRQLAMRLASNASQEQIEAATVFLEAQNKVGMSYLLGLRVLKDLDHNGAMRLIEDRQSALLRKFGAITGKKLFTKSPEIVKCGLTNADPDISKFCRDILDINVN